jgi:hypothetical protein
MWEKRNALWGLMGKLEGKSSLGRPSQRLDDNIKMDHRKMTGQGLNSSGLG